PVPETRHRAAAADAPDVRPPGEAVDPAALRHIADDDRSPTPDLDDAARRSVFGREVSLLVVSASIASFMYCLREQKRRTQRLVELNHRRLARRLLQQVQERLRAVVRLHWASGDTDDRNAGARPPAPAQIIGQ